MYIANSVFLQAVNATWNFLACINSWVYVRDVKHIFATAKVTFVQFIMVTILPHIQNFKISLQRWPNPQIRAQFHVHQHVISLIGSRGLYVESWIVPPTFGAKLKPWCAAARIATVALFSLSRNLLFLKGVILLRRRLFRQVCVCLYN